MRLPMMPPDWRQLFRGGIQPWQVAAVVAAIAGAGWLLSPYAALERGARRVREANGRTPNAVGQALGYGAGVLRSPVTDPLETLAMRATAQGAGTPRAEYRGGRSAYFRPPLPTRVKVTWPLRAQNMRPLGAQAPVYGVPILPGPGVSRTAAEILHAQLGERGG